jgi:hypothetical protein
VRDLLHIWRIRPLVRATRRPRIAQPTVGAGYCWLTGQSDAPPDSLVNYSRMPLLFPRAAGSPPASLAACLPRAVGHVAASGLRLGGEQECM